MDTKTRTALLQDSFVRTPNHGRLHYRSAGDTGDAVVLLHSNGGSACQFDRVVELLASEHRVFSWTMPGHGDSDRITRHYSIEDYGDAVAEFMTAVGVERAFVAGSSVGGSIAADMAARHAGRLLGATVVEAPCRTYEEWGARWPHTEGNFSMPLQTPEVVKERVANATPEVVQRWNIDRNKAGAWLMVDVMWAIREFDVRAALARCAVPARIVYGKLGPNAANQDRLRAVAPQIPIEEMEGSGHFPMLDAPDGLAQVLRAAFASQSTG